MSSREARLGKYKVIAELGRGGMSRVYLAAAAGPGGFHKLVVLKLLLDELSADDPSFVPMFLDEAKLAARLNHPRIVQTNEVGQEDGRYYIAMEYLAGQPLHQILRRSSKSENALPLPFFLGIVADALEGLHAAHTAKDFDGAPLLVVHRDASPQNIFVTYDGQVKVMDFGIAKAAGRGGEATRLGVLKGKVVYMAPEQVEDGARVDHRADIFAIGIILHDFLAKRRMWEGLSEVEVVSRLMRRAYTRSPRATNPDVPEVLDEICKRALAPHPADRYADARAMCDDLRAHLLLERSLPSDREIGAFVAALFAREREQVARVIQRQLQTVDEESDEPLPRLQSITPATPTPAPGAGTLTPSAMNASPEPARPSRRRTGAIVAGAAVAAAAALFWLVPRAPAADGAPTRVVEPAAPARRSVPTTTVAAPVPTPAEVAALDPAPATTPRPRPVVAPTLPTFSAARPALPAPVVRPSPPVATATIAKSTATSEPAPPATAPRSTKPDLGY